MILELKKVNKSFLLGETPVQVLHDIDLHMDPGDCRAAEWPIPRPPESAPEECSPYHSCSHPSEGNEKNSPRAVLAHQRPVKQRARIRTRTPYFTHCKCFTIGSLSRGILQRVFFCAHWERRYNQSPSAPKAQAQPQKRPFRRKNLGHCGAVQLMLFYQVCALDGVLILASANLFLSCY